MTPAKTRTQPTPWIVARAMSIGSAALLVGDRLTEDHLRQLPAGRVETLKRVGWIKHADA